MAIRARRRPRRAWASRSPSRGQRDADRATNAHLDVVGARQRHVGAWSERPSTAAACTTRLGRHEGARSSRRSRADGTQGRHPPWCCSGSPPGGRRPRHLRRARARQRLRRRAAPRAGPELAVVCARPARTFQGRVYGRSAHAADRISGTARRLDRYVRRPHSVRTHESASTRTSPPLMRELRWGGGGEGEETGKEKEGKERAKEEKGERHTLLLPITPYQQVKRTDRGRGTDRLHVGADRRSARRVKGRGRPRPRRRRGPGRR